ncbi:MAG: hypothetical protein J2P45_26675, partial [Candidatus Dormibacteraeota bacterium]|nr:hypothetical protein [Candidatus Dormibacteraeota bacterium]
MDPTTFTFPESAFPPLAVGFFGLGTGYLIYGPQELLGLPKGNRAVNLSTGLWGIWMPGFMQFLVGIYLFAGLVWFHSITAPPLYMAAFAFTAYGVHWWAIGGGRALGGDPRPNAFMAVAFTLLSLLGVVVFSVSSSRDVPVALLFAGLTLIYVADIFASFFPTAAPEDLETVRRFYDVSPEQAARLGALGQRALGALHIA